MLAPQQPLFDWTVQHLSCCSALVSIKVIKPQRKRLQGQKGKMLFFSSFMIKRCNWDLTETSIEKRTSHNMGPYWNMHSYARRVDSSPAVWRDEPGMQSCFLSSKFHGPWPGGWRQRRTSSLQFDAPIQTFLKEREKKERKMQWADESEGRRASAFRLKLMSVLRSLSAPMSCLGNMHEMHAVSVSLKRHASWVASGTTASIVVAGVALALAGAGLLPLHGAGQAPRSSCMCRACWRDVTWNGEQLFLLSCLSLISILHVFVVSCKYVLLPASFFPCHVVDMRKSFYPIVFPIFPSRNAHFYPVVHPRMCF